MAIDDARAGSHADRGEEAYAVRPYAVTGGRTRPNSEHMPIEALVQALAGPATGMTPEKRAILELTTTQYLSVAELSAHVHLPVGVVRVLVGDLADAQQVRVHGLVQADAHSYGPATTLSVLESVLNGISSL